MKRVKSIIILGIYIFYAQLLGLGESKAQQSQRPQQYILSSVGSSYQGKSIVVDWTLGELAVTTIYGSSNVISQGFHQPKLIITALNDLNIAFTKVLVYPNPTSDLVIMNLNFDKIHPVQVSLHEITGKILWQANYKGQQIQETTSLGNYANGTYLFSVILTDTNSKQTFKIQKTN